MITCILSGASDCVLHKIMSHKMSRAGAENLQYAMFLRVLQSSFPIFSMLSPHLLSQCFSIAFIAFLQLFIACLYCFYGCRCSLLFCHFNNNNKLEGKKIRNVPSFLHYIQSLRLELVNGACFSLSHFWFCSVFFLYVNIDIQVLT